MDEKAKRVFMPQEELLEKTTGKKNMTIGIPRENKDDETRISLTPEATKILVENGHEVILERGAGNGSKYSDKDYSDNGVTICETPEMVFGCDMILKITPFTLQEIDMMKGNQLVISFLNVLMLSDETLNAMMRKRITALASEKIKDPDGNACVMQAMSEISGIYSVLIASKYLSSMEGGKGNLLGGITGITPSEVVILGANTAGEYAARAALGLGATVKVFDASLQRLRSFQSVIGQRLYTSNFHPQVLKKALHSADVLIGAIELDDLRPWYYVTEDMVQGMKKGSVIIDLSIDRGGCIETTECRQLKNPVYEKFGVIHYSAWNIPSLIPRTASIALSNVFRPLILEIAHAGGINSMLKRNQHLRSGVYLFNGILTNETLGQKFGMLSKDINLLMAAF
jgi:alanine dehydrogenase